MTSCKADGMGGTVDQAGTAGCDATCDPNGKDSTGMDCNTPTPNPTPTPATCTFDADGWTCDDMTSCKADGMGGTIDQAGTAGCDATCDPNGKDSTGMVCTAPAVVCTFAADGWTCDDGASCTADAMGGTVDEAGTAGCDATCDPNGVDAAGMTCTRRLAVQDILALGQN